MRQIAEQAGIGKSTLYDYFRTKEEILTWGVEDELMDLTEAAQKIAAMPLSAIERLRRIMKIHAEMLLASKDQYLKVMFEVQRLSLESQKRIQVRRHRYQDLICGLIEEGIRQGAFRPVDPLLAARMLIMAITPSIFTVRPTGSPQQMISSGMDIIMRGIQA